MATSTVFATTLVILFFLRHLPAGSHSTTVTLVNNCQYTVWAAIVSRQGTNSPPFTTGFALQPGESGVIAMPAAWSGRIWGRTHCSQDSTGKLSCVTGDCASSTECAPATIAELTLNDMGVDSYRVSLDYGFNLPMKVEPQGGSSNCKAASCTADLNTACPVELKVVVSGGETVGCKSGCQAFPCDPNLYSQFFKRTCPDAFVNGYNGGTFFCSSDHDYLITFQSTSSMVMGDPTTTTAVVKTGGQGLSKTIQVVFVVIGILVGGYGAYKVRCLCSNRNCNAELEMGAGN